MSKKFDDKIGKKNCWKKKLKIDFFLQKILKNGYLEDKAYGESKKNLKFQKKVEIGP